MKEIENLSDVQVGDVLVIGANGKETRHAVTEVGTPPRSYVEIAPEFGGRTGTPVQEGSIFDSLQKVGALRILRPEPPFSFDKIGYLDAPGFVCFDGVGMHPEIVFKDLYPELRGKKLRVRIDEVRE